MTMLYLIKYIYINLVKLFQVLVVSVKLLPLRCKTLRFINHWLSGKHLELICPLTAAWSAFMGSCFIYFYITLRTRDKELPTLVLEPCL